MAVQSRRKSTRRQVQHQEYVLTGTVTAGPLSARDALVSQQKPTLEAFGLPFWYAYAHLLQDERGAAVPNTARSVCDSADAATTLQGGGPPRPA